MANTAGDGFVRAQGMQYLKFFEAMHQALRPEWYLEIGTQTGASLKISAAKSISVDPAYRLSHEVMQNKPALHSFQETSDAFFASKHMKKLGAKIDMAFLDGMHLFEFLLRDFIGTERESAKNGVIVMHDCLPWTARMALRDRETSVWTGDVWKMVPILQKYRPDLEIDVVDAAPTGLVIVSKLDPKNTALEDNYDAILEEFLDLDLNQFGVARYFSSFQIQSAAESRWLCEFPHDIGEGWQTNPDIAIKIAAPTRDKMTRWGDYHFARGLARAFCKMGYKTFIAPQNQWYDQNAPGGIDLVLRGRVNFNRQPERTCLTWAISKGLRPINFSQSDHIFWASKKLYEADLEQRGPGVSSLLPQAFDKSVMRHGNAKSREGIVFVGRARAAYERPSLTHIEAANEDVRIWGPGWRDTQFEKYVVADGVENSELPAIYQSAEIVLNDHTDVMQNNGFLSNRIFDTLACGAIPLSKDVGWLPDDIAEFVYLYDDQAGFEAGLAKARAESSQMRAKRKALAKKIISLHSFDARAREILEVATSIRSVSEAS